jgi:hypothetical protein
MGHVHPRSLAPVGSARAEIVHKMLVTAIFIHILLLFFGTRNFSGLDARIELVLRNASLTVSR